MLNFRQELEVSCRHLMIIKDKLAKNAQALELVKKCQNVHQRFMPLRCTAVVLANKPELHRPTGSSAHSYLK